MTTIDRSSGQEDGAGAGARPPADAHLAALHEIALDLMNRREVRDLLDTILARAAALAGTDHGYIYVTEGGDHLRAESVLGTFEGLHGWRLTSGVGLAGKALDSGVPISVSDYDSWEGRDPDYPRGVLGSGLCVPLAAADGAVIGVIGLAFTESGRSFGEDDIERLTGFARLASIALENARLHESARRELQERTRSDETLRETEESYQRLVELSPDGIVVHIDNRFVFANASAAAMLGVARPEDLLGLSVMGFIHADHREPVLERRRLMLDLGTSVPFVERQFLRADGSAFDVEVGASPMMYRGQEAIQAVFRDITERKASERALQEAEESFRVLIERLPVVTYRYGPDGVTPLYISPQIEDLLGCTPDDWLADPAMWERLVHPDDREPVVRENHRTTETGEPFVLEYRFLRQDGGTVWIHDESTIVSDRNGRPRFWQGVMVDITERKAAEEALEEAEAKYRSLVERLPSVTYTFANPTMEYDARHNYVSPQISDLLGCEPQEWLADESAWRAFVHPEDVGAVDSQWRDAGRRGEPFDIEYRMVARDGRIVWVRERSAAVIDDHGVARFWQGVIEDITEQRDAREAMTVAFEQEREASHRLRALDEMKNTFLAAVSHELRTPLSAILGLALTLEREELELDPVESRELLRRLASNARKLNRLLSDFLDLDRLGRGILEPRRRPTDVADLVRQVIENSDALDADRLRLDLEPVVADLDAAKVERIVENLLANAIRHTPADAAIWVRTRAVDGGVLVAVDDDGPGIPDDLRAEVFEPFRQVPGRNVHSPGVGIGLSLVARFAELHGGRAWVEPRDGGGSSFRVLIPSAGPEERSPSSAAS